ncbi:MAG: hypothetical protein K2Q18_08860 [Bdellovibrionales bacterium]|nr:hypothetical protein [Bdellovibrionales bacterium]
MKALLLLLALPIALQAQTITCEMNDLNLSINVLPEEKVQWVISLNTTKIEGAGVWQKEVESVDAFSSYDDESAISYKNGKAVFVFDSGRGEVIFFPECKSEL